jgi:TolB protein
MNSSNNRIAAWTIGLDIAAMLAPAQADERETRLTRDGRPKRDTHFVPPDGEGVVFVVQPSPILWQMNYVSLADGEVRPLHPEATTSEFAPSYSADGRYFAYVRSLENLSLALVLRDNETSQTVEIKPEGGFCGFQTPFVCAERGRLYFSYATKGRQPIQSVDLLGGERQVVCDSAGQNLCPQVTADGRTMVWESTRDGNCEIYESSINGDQIRRLTDSPTMDTRPVLSPDGKRIAFTSNRDGNYEIYVLERSGGKVTRITHNDERDDYAAWNTRGNRLVFVGERGGQQDLYLIDVSGGDPQ